jgi:formylglycine-generating enzyme required for sulfatase activity
VLGVSFEDAKAFAAWRTARARAAGRDWTFSLPTFPQWAVAACTVDRVFPFGKRFRPKWTKSCFARSRATPEPVLRFPRDESPFGVYDLCGSVAEILDDWFDRSRGLKRVAAGSWAHGKPDLFPIQASVGWSPSNAGDEAGFRLAAVEEVGAR